MCGVKTMGAATLITKVFRLIGTNIEFEFFLSPKLATLGLSFNPVFPHMQTRETGNVYK